MHKKLSKEKIITLIMISTILLVLITLFIIFYQDISHKIYINFLENKDDMIELLKGLLNTFLITIVAFLFGIFLGMLVCLIEGNKSKNTFMIILKNITKTYVSIFRGTPATVQLLIFYFVIFASFRGNAIYIAMLVFGLNSGAYVSEIIRGGINSIPKGQMEAGRSLGLPYNVVMRKIILPQAIKNALPSLGNEFIALIKETSVAGFIGAVDLTLAFRKIANNTYDVSTVYIVMGISYFLIVLLITILLKKLERRLLNNVKVK